MIHVFADVELVQHCESISLFMQVSQTTPIDLPQEILAQERPNSRTMIDKIAITSS